jgi:hypothetical protein
LTKSVAAVVAASMLLVIDAGIVKYGIKLFIF